MQAAESRLFCVRRHLPCRLCRRRRNNAEQAHNFEAGDNGNQKISVDIPNIDRNDIDFFSDISEQGEADKKYYISKREEKVLNCWDEFIHGIKEKVLGFPVWAFEFSKDYDYSISDYPNWRKNFIGRNRRLYENNKTFIDSWLKKWNYLQDFTTTEQKLEWQCGADCESVWDGIIQFRPSDITVKRPNVFPALVAMVQIPIIGKVRRRLTPREAARLQSRIPLYATKTIIRHTSNSVAPYCVTCP